MSYTFGTDPEFMIEDSNGNIRSAIEIIKKNKTKPISKNGCKLYFDNVMAECTIPPARSKQEAVNNIRVALSFIHEVLPKGFKLKTLSSHTFSKSDLDNEEAQKISCKEEFCAYLMDTVDLSKEIPKQVGKQGDNHFFFRTNLRTAGGHVHAGDKTLTNELIRLMFIRMMDLFMGIPSIWIDKDSTSKTRKKLYGKAGRYRTPPHGAEYRSMGNFWLSRPSLVELIYDITEFTTEFVKSGKHNDFWKIDLDKLNSDEFWNNGGNPTDCHVCIGYNHKAKINAINDMNKELATDLIDLVNQILPNEISDQMARAIEEPLVSLNEGWKL